MLYVALGTESYVTQGFGSLNTDLKLACCTQSTKDTVLRHQRQGQQHLARLRADSLHDLVVIGERM